MRFRAFLVLLMGCSSSTSSPDDSDAGIKEPAPDSGAMPKDSGTSSKDSGADADGGMVIDDSGSFDSGPAPSIVYGHTADALYSFDVATTTVILIGKFSGCTQTMGLTQVIDLAVDEKGN